MRPSTGVAELSSTKPVARVSPLMPKATPMSAVSTGMPAATSEPKVIASTTRATER